MVDVRWQAWNDNGLEHCVVETNEGGMNLTGAVVGARETKYGAFYSVRTDEFFAQRKFVSSMPAAQFCILRQMVAETGLILSRDRLWNT